MLTKMRRRFVLTAMTAVFTVLVLLVATINIINFSTVTARQDRTLSIILRLGTREGIKTDGVHASGRGWSNTPKDESQNSMRYFVIHCDERGNVYDIQPDSTSSALEEVASDYAVKVLAEKSTSGYSGVYRYLVEYGDGVITIALVNSAIELKLVRYVLMISGAVVAVTFLLIFALMILLSRQAILPYAKSMEKQKQFITDAGHEIKTPLTSIATSADVLAVEHEGDEWVENIRKQSIRLAKLVNHLVTLSRLDEATPFPDKTTFSLSEAAWETSEPFAALAKAGGKSYTQSIAEELTITGDKTAIQQMISILLDNAVRYSSDGGQIQLTVCQKSGRIWIEVFNTCEPIPKGDIAHLFDRFYRPDRSRSKHTGGTGIGLSIAKATAEGHGGKISVKSPSRDSIRFTVIL